MQRWPAPFSMIMGYQHQALRHRPHPMERSTRQRAAILAAIADAHRPLTPQEVLDNAREAVQGLGMATVYRNIKALLDDGALQAVQLPGESPRYETAEHGHGHHHHFQCTVCSRVFDVHDCPGDLRDLAPKGFTVERHELTLYGRCADCANAAAAPKARAKPPAAA